MVPINGPITWELAKPGQALIGVIEGENGKRPDGFAQAIARTNHGMAEPVSGDGELQRHEDFRPGVVKLNVRLVRTDIRLFAEMGKKLPQSLRCDNGWQI